MLFSCNNAYIDFLNITKPISTEENYI